MRPHSSQGILDAAARIPAVVHPRPVRCRQCGDSRLDAAARIPAVVHPSTATAHESASGRHLPKDDYHKKIEILSTHPRNVRVPVNAGEVLHRLV